VPGVAVPLGELASSLNCPPLPPADAGVTR
jgi:hypothetical protein